MTNTDIKDALLARVLSLNIEHLRYREIWSELDSLRPIPGIDHTPRHLFLYGESGVGKSTLVRKYWEAHPGYVDVDEDGTEYDICPVVYTDLPQPYTMSAFYQQIVRALGAPQMAGAKIELVKTQAMSLIEQQRVEMLILDEMDFILTSHSVSHRAAMEAIKSLTNRRKFSVVCVGTSATKKLTEINFQYFSRFPAIKLPRFVECDGQFCDLLKEVEEHLALPTPLGLGDLTVGYPQLLHKMCLGILRPLINILQRAFIVMLNEHDLEDLDNHELFVKTLLSARKYVLGESEEKFQELLNKAEAYEE